MENDEELFIYFAHPIKTYATKEALKILKAIKEEYPGYKILDPEDIDIEGGWVSCQDCMQTIMKKIFFPLIEKSSIFAIWSPIATCGIECELHYAWYLGKPCIYISYFAGEVEFEDLVLQEYHRTETVMEVE